MPSEAPMEMPLLGESAAIVELRKETRHAARTLAKVLILGETGVGKEVVANLIHRSGPRQGRAFVALNCSGVPETLLESELFGHVRGSFTGAYRDKPGLVRQAQGGTLFLDELGEMSLRMQAILLRFTETGEYQAVGADRASERANARLITATNRDLRTQIDDGHFREDLFYRLNVIQLHVPPLRERPSDVPILMRHFLAQASTQHRLPCPTLSSEADVALQGYRWPGNVRELKNVTERLVVRGVEGPITFDDLPAELRRPASPSLVSRRPVRGEAQSAAYTHANVDGLRPTVADALWQRMVEGDNFWSIAAICNTVAWCRRASLAMRHPSDGRNPGRRPRLSTQMPSAVTSAAHAPGASRQHTTGARAAPRRRHISITSRSVPPGERLSTTCITRGCGRVTPETVPEFWPIPVRRSSLARLARPTSAKPSRPRTSTWPCPCSA